MRPSGRPGPTELTQPQGAARACEATRGSADRLLVESIYSKFSKFRDELLDRQLLVSVKQAHEGNDAHQQKHEERRPPSSLKYTTPMEFAAALHAL